jgi:hypothetical protein
MRHMLLLAMVTALAMTPLAGKTGGSRRSTTRCATCTRTSKGKIQRSVTAKRAFQRSHPCPSTGKATGACKGYVVDHVKPLACGGADAPSNMQWQTKAAAKAKDKTERAGCGGR